MIRVTLLAAAVFIRAVCAEAALCNPCIFVANQSSGQVTVIDGETNEAILNIPAGQTPQFLAAHPNGSRVFVSTHGAGNQGVVAVIDTLSMKVVANLNVGLNPTALAVNPVTSELYVLNSGENTVSVIDTTALTVVATVPLPVRPYDVVVSPDGTRVYLSSLSGAVVKVLNASTKGIIGSISAIKGPTGLAIDGKGQLLYVADVVSNQVAIVSTGTLTVTGTASAGTGPIALALDGSGATLYVVNFASGKGDTVTIVSTATKGASKTIPVGKRPRGVAVDAKTGRPYISSLAAAGVVMIDPLTTMVSGSIPVGADPVGIAVVYAVSTAFTHCADQVKGGTPYNMDEPLFVNAGGNRNKDTCAYRFWADLHTAGYNTEGTGSPITPQLTALHTFQTKNGLPVDNLVTKALLAVLEPQVAAREAQIAPVAKAFPLHGMTQPMHPHDVSKAWAEYLHHLPMTVLPKTLQMNADETKGCIWGHCAGKLLAANNKDVPCVDSGCNKLDLGLPHRFTNNYFRSEPEHWMQSLPSASILVGTTLHEYGHYLDGTMYKKDPTQPHRGSIDSVPFYEINYDMSKKVKSVCAARRTGNVKDWITDFGFTGAVACPAGFAAYREHFAESFSMYVHDGQGFRAAGQLSPFVAKAYAWLKANVFQNIEYDTHMQRGVESGCTDAAGKQAAQPGYATCNASFVWDGTLKIK